ncbi:hypothetical protein BO443_20306 [Burkholderia orbicola]
MAEAGIEPSVDSRGDGYDNALAETINGLYKTELIHRRARRTAATAADSSRVMELLPSMLESR